MYTVTKSTTKVHPDKGINELSYNRKPRKQYHGQHTTGRLGALTPLLKHFDYSVTH